MHTFKTVRELSERLKESPLVFTSPPERLRGWHILLQSLASGDFNPHTRHETAGSSMFGGVVSHGVGTLARGEGWFVRRFTRMLEAPVEIIGKGYARARYLSPLRLGETYQYRYEIPDMRFRKGRWDFDCRITCEVVGPNARVVAESLLQLSLVERESPYIPETREMIVADILAWWVMTTFFAVVSAANAIALLPVPTVTAQPVPAHLYDAVLAAVSTVAP